jgi:hypothetical protein
MSSSSAVPKGPAPADALRRNRILSSKLYFDVPGSKVNRSAVEMFLRLLRPLVNLWLRLRLRRLRWSTRRRTTSPSSESRSCESAAYRLSIVYLTFFPGYGLRLFLCARLLLCRHPFDSSKWGRICRFLTGEGHLEKSRVIEPLEASKEDLLVVRTKNQEAVFAWL